MWACQTFFGHCMCLNLLFKSVFSTFFCHEVMLPEVMQVLRGAGKVGSALVATQGEQLRLMACTSSVGAGLKAAQDVVNGLVGAFAGSNQVRLYYTINLIMLSMIRHSEGCSRVKDHYLMTAHAHTLNELVFLCCVRRNSLCRRMCFQMLRVGRTLILKKRRNGASALSFPTILWSQAKRKVSCRTSAIKLFRLLFLVIACNSKMTGKVHFFSFYF